MRFRTHKMCELDDATLLRLRSLTNDVTRGDKKDSGQGAGSIFRVALDAHLNGIERFPHDAWGIIVRDWLTLAGWCMLRHITRDPDTDEPLIVPTAAAGFYVSPKYRRHGLGRQLVREALEVARKNGMGRMLVNPWNKSSAGFFRSCGFKEVSSYITGWCPGIAAIDVK